MAESDAKVASAASETHADRATVAHRRALGCARSMAASHPASFGRAVSEALRAARSVKR
jgi:hypothetical protein